MDILGGRIAGTGTEVRVDGLGLRGMTRPSKALDCGNSATTMRLLMGVLAGQPWESILFGDASLTSRPMKRVAEPLGNTGARFELAAGGRPPVKVFGRHPLKAQSYTLKVASAQVKTALLLAGLFSEGETSVADPFLTRDHTERMLGFLSGGEAIRVEGDTIHIEPYLLKSDAQIAVPGDISSAAYFAAAAALLPGSEILLRDVLLNPTRLGFFDVLKDMGAVFQTLPKGEAGGEPFGDIQINASSLKGVHVKASRVPKLIDEVPLLAVAAAQAHGETRIDGLAELRLKESDRLSGTAEALTSMGAEVRIESDSLIIKGPARLKGARIETHHDHRLAMAFSVAALTAEGDTYIEDADSASISFPSFFEEFARLTR